MNTVSHKYRQSALLLLTAAIWGSAFVAQQTGMDYVGPFTFNAARSLLGGLALLPLIAFFSSREKRSSAQQASADHTADRKTLWTGGILCGIVLFAASTLQQVGIQYTTVGKAGFITAQFFTCYFFIFGWKIQLARYAKINAADVPTAPAFNPPWNNPKKPLSFTASFTPWNSRCPNPSSGTDAPAPAYSANGS